MASKDKGHHERRGSAEKYNQSLIGEPFATGSSPGGGPDLHAALGDPELVSGSGKDGEGAEPIAIGGNYDAKYTKPVAEQDFDEVHGHKTDIPWSSGQGSGFDRDWQEDQPAVSGAPAEGPDWSVATGAPELVSGSLKDGEGAEPIVLGGNYSAKYTKPTAEQDFDAVHGHKTDIPWDSGQGSGFDRDWGEQPEASDRARSGLRDWSVTTSDPELVTGISRLNEGNKPVALGGHYGKKYTKPAGEQDFDAVHGHKTDIPWDSGQGSGFDRDWQSEE